MLEKLKENWQRIKERVRDEYDITNVSYKTWIEPLQVYNIRNGNIVQIIFTGGNGDFEINFVTKRYSIPLQVTIEEIIGLDCSVEILPEQTQNNNRPVKKMAGGNAGLNFSRANLNPRYTFDTFVVGTNNQFAHAASLSVAEAPGREYNPLFIYGGPGLGKTHLMHSIAHFIMNNDPKTNILYVTSEVFTNEVIDAIRNKNGVTMSEFRNKYRNIDVLLIDDIQFIIGKESTQEEFFNTFNFLYENGRQIVISSDQPPKSFTTLDDRLRSRFEWGLSVDITTQDYETRMAILHKKEDNENYTVDNEILQYIATNIRTNIRELEGALTKIYFFSKLHPNTPLTLDVAKEILKDNINPDDEKKLTPEYIIEVVAEHYGVRTEDIKSQRRNREIVLPRQVSMYLIRLFNDITLQDVGRILGNRDHSTIIHGFDKITNEMARNPELRNTIEILKKKLNQSVHE